MADAPTFSPIELAGQARSILSCPGAVSMVVDGREHLHGQEHGLVLEDRNGIPTFVCRSDSPVDLAGRAERPAILEVTSGLASAQADSVVLAGRLSVVGVDCLDGEQAAVIALEVTRVVVIHTGTGTRPEFQFQVPMELYRSPEHHLNAGYLKRSLDHANHCHQDELRHSIAQATGTHLSQLAGVTLAGLDATGVDIHWVASDGAHLRTIRFPHPARNPHELADLLRRELHAGIC